jgi:hypothetical protein
LLQNIALPVGKTVEELFGGHIIYWGAKQIAQGVKFRNE